MNKTPEDQETTFNWKVASNLGGGEEKGVEVDKISLNSFEKLNTGEKPRNALKTVRETYCLPSLSPI